MKNNKIVFFIVVGMLILLQSPLWARQAATNNLTNLPAATKDKTLHNEVQMTDIHDIKPLERINFNPALLWYLALGGILLAMLAAMIVYWSKRQKKKIPEFVAVVSPQEAALNMLDKLQPLMNSDAKRFYFELSMVLREYIAQRFSLGAPEMTTEELLSRVPELKIENGLIRKLKEFVHASDPIKFADRPAETEKMKYHIGFVRDFVKKTTPLSADEKDELNLQPAVRGS